MSDAINDQLLLSEIPALKLSKRSAASDCCRVDAFVPTAEAVSGNCGHADTPTTGRAMCNA